MTPKQAAPLCAAAAVVAVVAVVATVPSPTDKPAPFVLIPAGPAAEQPEQVRAPEPARQGTRACTPNDLELATTRYAAAPDQALVEVTFTNRGTECGLRTNGRFAMISKRTGRPFQEFTPNIESDPRGQTGVTVMRVGEGDVVRRRLVLTGTACGAVHGASAEVRLGVNGSDVSAAVDREELAPCATAGGPGGLRFEPWLPELPDRFTSVQPEPRGPYDGAPLDVELLDMRRDGDRALFVVRVTNVGDEPFLLEPCPTYLMVAGQGGTGVETFAYLNCDSVDDSIPPNESVEFRMETGLPPESVEVPLTWNLGNGVRTEDTPRALPSFRSVRLASDRPGVPQCDRTVWTARRGANDAFPTRAA